jgi:signal transduction histidine kinase
MTNNKQDTPDSKICPGISSTRAFIAGSGRGRLLWIMLIGSIVMALALPLGNILIIYPAFTDVLVRSIENDTEKIAAHLVPAELKFSEITKDSLTQRFYGDIYKLEHDFGIVSVKLYSNKGEILYSTEAQEIGSFTSQDYFFNIVSKGERHTKMIIKGSDSLEDTPVRYDIVETYFPIMNGKRFLGAFELYYDITETKGQLDALLFYSTLIMTVMAACLVISMLFLLRKEALKHMAENRAKILKADIDRITHHDLKTPFISILSGIEYLEKFTNLDNDQFSMITQMRDAADTGLDQINRSLGLYRMEKGTYVYTPQEMDILHLTQRVAGNLNDYALYHGVKMIITHGGKKVEEGDSIPFKAEETLCYTVMANLIKNSIEASERDDKVTINLDEKDGVALTVHNPTPVPEEIRQTFFDKYSTSGRPSGTGLGTYSAQLIVKTMGGTIALSTSQESGTLITVKLPWPTNPDE